jgi:D-alanyl-D-alanine dipeptidase
MNVREYTSLIEAKDILHKRLEQNYPVVDNGSSLVSLLDTGFDLAFEPSIMKNYRYMVREELLEKIKRISESLSKDDKKLIIRSAWRSFQHQRVLWERNFGAMRRKFPDKSIGEIEQTVSYFIAPYNKSTHTTGGAVDALILNTLTNEVLDFGTNKGLKISLNKKCYPHHPNISNTAKENRQLLIDLFINEGFVCDLKEYWHFDYGNVGWAIESKASHAIYGIIESYPG